MADAKSGMSPLGVIWSQGALGVTALTILSSNVCGLYVSWGFGAQTTVHPTDFITNNIPFSNLNLAIGLGMVVNIILSALFKYEGVNGLQLSAVLLAILLPKKKARKHVALRLRQLIDRFTVGRNNSVSPIVSIALGVRAQVEDSPQLSTRRWAVPSARYAVSLPEFQDIMEITDISF